MVNIKLHIHFEDRLSDHNRPTKYLEVTPDKTHNYREHLKKTAMKLRSWNIPKTVAYSKVSALRLVQ